MTMILELLSQKGLKYTRSHRDPKRGTVYYSPCPKCGGDDRFLAFPDQGEGGTWSCRGCDKGGDLITFLRHFDGLSFAEACERLGLEKGRTYRGLPQAPRPVRQPAQEAFTGAPKDLPPALWAEKADKFISEAQIALFTSPAGEAALVWLERRGIEPAEADACRLGYLPEPRFRARSGWGLPDLEFVWDESRVKGTKFYIPRGLVIPTFRVGTPVALRIRRAKADLRDPKRSSKYFAVAGSAAVPFVALSHKSITDNPRVWVVVESQLDAIMIAERARRLPIGAMAMLSDTGKPCPQTHALLAASDRILVALDYDPAGKKGADWWLKTYRQAVRWPALEGKDPGEYFALGGNIHEWINDGLPSNLKARM